MTEKQLSADDRSWHESAAKDRWVKGRDAERMVKEAGLAADYRVIETGDKYAMQRDLKHSDKPEALMLRTKPDLIFEGNGRKFFVEVKSVDKTSMYSWATCRWLNDCGWPVVVAMFSKIFTTPDPYFCEFGKAGLWHSPFADLRDDGWYHGSKDYRVGSGDPWLWISTRNFRLLEELFDEN